MREGPAEKMNLQRYRELKARPQAHESYRTLCPRCLQPHLTCFCRYIQTFDPRIQFVILIHPLEVRRRIATGRMSHLVLQNSRLVQGHDFSENETVNLILQNPGLHSVILYPGRASTNLSRVPAEKRPALFPTDKELVIFVIDGTWSTAGKMLRHSQNLHALPQICFTPEKPSTFRVRQQPKVECYSTIEAIHHTLELVGPARGFDPRSGEQKKLLRVFDKMVEQQLEFIRESRIKRPFSRHRKKPPPSEITE